MTPKKRLLTHLAPTTMSRIDNEIMRRTSELNTTHNRLKDIIIYAKSKNLPAVQTNIYLLFVLDDIYDKIGNLANELVDYMQVLTENLNEHNRYLTLSHVKYYKNLLQIYENEVLFIVEELGVSVPRKFFD